MKRFHWLRFDAPERPRPSAARRRLACERVESRRLLDGSDVLTDAVVNDPVVEMVAVDPPLYLNAANGNILFNSQSFADPVLGLPQSNEPANNNDSPLDPLYFDPFNLDPLNFDPAILSRNESYGQEVDLGDSNSTISSSLPSFPLRGMNINPGIENDANPVLLEDPLFAMEPIDRGTEMGSLPFTLLGPLANSSVENNAAPNASSNPLLDLIFGSSFAPATTLRSTTTTEQQTPELQRLPVTSPVGNTHVENPRVATQQPQFIDISQTFVNDARPRLSTMAQENLARLRNEAALADERRLASVAPVRNYEAEPRRGIIRAFESSHGPERVYTRHTREVNPTLEIAKLDDRRRALHETMSAHDRQVGKMDVNLGERELLNSAISTRLSSTQLALNPHTHPRTLSQVSAGETFVVGNTTGDEITLSNVWHEAWHWLTDQCFSISYHARRSVAQTGVVVLASVAALAYYPRTPEASDNEQPRLRRTK